MENTLGTRLREHYLHSPEQVSIVLQHSGQPDQPITYRELMEGAAAYANTMEANGILPGEVVVLILQHGRDLIYAFFGAILHGSIPSIMPYLTEKLLPERYRADLRSLVSITRPVGIVTYPEFESEVRAALQIGDSVRAVISSSQIPRRENPDFDQFWGLRHAPDDIVLLQHSSGTTGLQKGVALSHRAVLNQLDAYSRAVRLTTDDVIVSWLPLYHDMGLIAGFLQPILMKVPLILMSPFDWVRAPYRLLQSVSQYRGTLTWLPNFAYNFCAQKIRDRQLTGVDLSSWRAVINCSEPVRYESHEMFYEQFKGYGLRKEALSTCYAMAENVFAVTQSDLGTSVRVDEIDRDRYQIERIARPISVDGTNGRSLLKMLSCGRPIENTSVRILTTDGKDAGERCIGEIAVHSDCMLNEYYQRPEETKKAFMDGWYLTGDFGYLADGELFVSGRKKDLIIVGGKNIYPQDLERLAMEVPGVHPGRVVAFGLYDEKAGTEEVVIVAEVDGEEESEKEAIADGIRDHITRGSAISLRNVYLVEGQWLIKTSSGKTARLANREKYLAEISLLETD